MRSTLLILALICPLTLASARAADAPTIRPVTLQECIQMALEQNFDIKIQRYTELFAQNNLTIATAAYEPTFNAGAEHGGSLRGGGIDDFNRVTPATSTENTILSTDISGTLPLTGMRYSSFVDAADSYGRSGRQTTNGIVFDNFEQTTGRVGLSMTQPLLQGLMIDTIRYQILLAKNQLKASEVTVRSQFINTVTAVELAYYDLTFAIQFVKVQEKALELAERLLAENKKRVEVGAMAPLDEAQAESQVASRRSDVLSAQRIVASAQNALRNLVSDNYRSVHEVKFEPIDPLLPTPQWLDVQESWRKGLAARPDLQQARLNLNADDIDRRFYRNQTLPRLDFTGIYGHGASGVNTVEFSDALDDFREGSKPFYSYGARFSIPLGNTAPRTRYYNSKLALEQSRLQLDKLEQDVMVQIDNAVELAKTNFERIDSTHAARKYAEAALDAEQKKLENGKSTSFFVLQLQRDLTFARSEEINALSVYNKALAALAQAEGTTLQRRAVELLVK